MQKQYKLLSLFLVVIILVATISLSPQKVQASAAIQRLSGSDRYETAIEISENGWQQSDFAVLATGEDFPDALCAAPLAKKYNAPILLTSKDTLKTAVLDELKRLKVKQVFIIGGTGVISQDVQKQAASLGITCTRIYGSNRYETSTEVAKYLGTSSEIVVATGDDFPDALSIATIAASKGMPIILSAKDNIPQNVKQFLSGKNISKSYVIGGSGVLSDSVYKALPSPERIWGDNRYQTNLAVLNKFSTQVNFDAVYIATGLDFPDALSGSALAPKTSSPIVLVGSAPDKTIQDYITSKLSSIVNLKILGGEGAVSAGILSDILYSYNSSTAFTLIGTGKYQYTGTITIQNNGTSDIQNVSLDIDLGRLNDSPYQKEESVQVQGEGISIFTDMDGDKKAAVRFPLLKAGEKAEYKFTRNFTSGGIKYNADLSKTTGDYSFFSGYTKYTAPEKNIESDNSIIKSTASQIVKGETNPYLKARKIFEYVNTNIAYDFSESNKGALNALTTRKGVCEDFSDLFTAMARSVGIPSRVVYGYWLESLNFTGLEDLSSYRHAWPEFYLPEYGWIVAEPTVIKTNNSGTRLPAFEYFGRLNEPGHFLKGYENEPFYTMKYYTMQDVKPNIEVIAKEYISKQ